MKKQILFIAKRLIVLSFLAILIVKAHAQKQYAIDITIVTNESTPSITLQWPSTGSTLSWTIYKKNKNDASWVNFVASLTGTATSYTDNSIIVGSPYEYKVYRTGTSGTWSEGYVYAGIKVPAIDQRGTLILLVESVIGVNLNNEIMQLEQDLAGDGWNVKKALIDQAASVQEVKSIITGFYNADPTNVKSVFLLGRIPIPYSGLLNPDGHSDHYGAWPTDVYYGDMNESWTDVSANSTSASRPENRNIPGDGKFDLTYYTNVELQVGRVDLRNMTLFSFSEEDLLRRYLTRAHSFKTGKMQPKRAGMIDDNFGTYGSTDGFASNGWRNFTALVGPQNISSTGIDLIPTSVNNPVLLGWGGGAGDYTGASGVGSSGNFAYTKTQIVFLGMFGSYFGDWDYQDGFLKSPLASDSWTLATYWSGRPHWIMHHMGLGETIGYSTTKTQNNSSIYKYDYGTKMVHIGLLGDPSLRLHYVIPPTSVKAIENTTTIDLSWTASADMSITGYNIYRLNTATGIYALLNGSPVTGSTYSDNITAKPQTYIVRAIKLEAVPTGTYYNMSVGIPVISGGNDVTAPATVSGLSAVSVTYNAIKIKWNSSPEPDINGYKVYVNNTLVSDLIVGNNYIVQQLALSTSYAIKVSAVDKSGNESPLGTGIVTSTGTDVNPPTTPYFSLAGATETTLNLSISQSIDNYGVAYYEVQKEGIFYTTTTGSSISVTGLTVYTSYQFKVRAVDINGNASPYWTGNYRTADETSPSTPTNLTATGFTINSLTLSWDASIDNISVAGYIVVNNGGPLVTIPGLNYTITGLLPGSPYNYTVIGVDQSGNRSGNALLSITTPGIADIIPPSAPSGFTITGLSVTTSTGYSYFGLIWDASTDDLGVKDYIIYKNSSAIYTVSGLTISGQNNKPGVTDTYQIQARDYAGNLSSLTSLIVYYPDTYPPIYYFAYFYPVTSNNAVGNSYWNEANTIAGVQIYLNGSLWTSVTTVSGGYGYFSFTLLGLNASTAYSVQMIVQDNYGNLSELSPETSFNTTGTLILDFQPPSMPASFNADSILDVQVILSWAASTDNVGVAGYELIKGGVLVQTVSGITATISGLNESTAYTFGVRAFDAYGNRSDYIYLNLTTVGLIVHIPSTPGNVRLTTITSTKVAVSWTASIDIGGISYYNVYLDGGLAGTTSGTSFTVSGLNRSLNHTFNVEAVSLSLYVSEWSSDMILAMGGITGIIDNQLNTVSIYPVPATDYLNVKNLCESCTVMLSDLLGKSILQTKDAHIDLNGIVQGVYFVQILDSNKVIYRSKVIISK